jgi:hypothetical protein
MIAERQMPQDAALTHRAWLLPGVAIEGDDRDVAAPGHEAPAPVGHVRKAVAASIEARERDAVFGCEELLDSATAHRENEEPVAVGQSADERAVVAAVRHVGLVVGPRQAAVARQDATRSVANAEEYRYQSVTRLGTGVDGAIGRR